MTGADRDRSLPAGVILALAAHLVIFGLLSIAWGQQQPRAWPEPVPLEVSLVAEVAPEAQAPPAPEPPAPSIAPDQGLPEDAAPPPPPAPAALPEPARPAPPEPVAAKPVPAPKPAPVPPKKVPPVAAKPVPARQPAAKPAPAKPKPAAAKPAVAKPAATKPSPAKRSDRLAGLLPSTASGSNAAATNSRPRGQRLGDDFLKGLSADAPRRPASNAAPGAKPGPYPTASIVQAIARQIQPCADRQVNPGPGANRIVTTLNIRLNPDGTLAATPTKQRQSGLNDENERYAQRVTDLGVAAFKGCSPLKLPAEFYQTASGGWNNINYQWQLR
ncbi:MAG: TolA protein [Sphingomonas bacterium]|uniref:cell envelope biogenesis protein TolA n=1 Tax=Sphingomonas bacterium TaxID=1895847 RepID=UPI00262D9C72|nr:cell envelope biogenesis protein TolA [Sphingomonas bacterium]MDB5697057.1 TolA protein [Sphingomonas bacterium]